MPMIEIKGFIKLKDSYTMDDIYLNVNHITSLTPKDGKTIIRTIDKKYPEIIENQSIFDIKDAINNALLL